MSRTSTRANGDDLVPLGDIDLAQCSATRPDLHRTNRLREFIAAVEEHTSKAGELTPEKQAWIAWVTAKAGWIDPLVKRDDPILDAPEPREPSLWDF